MTKEYMQARFTKKGNMATPTKKEKLIRKLLKQHEFKRHKLQDRALAKDWLEEFTIEELKELSASIGENSLYKTFKEYFEKGIKPYQEVEIKVFQRVKEMIDEYCKVKKVDPIEVANKIIEDWYTDWNRHSD